MVNGQESKENEFVSKLSPVEKVLYDQLKTGFRFSGGFGEYLTYQVTEESFKVTNKVLDSLLVQKGYKKTDFTHFQKKVKEVLNIDIKPNELIHIDINNRCGENDRPYGIADGDFDVKYHLDTELQIFSPNLALPRITDYPKEYPHIAQIEDTMRTVFPGVGEGEYNRLERWKDWLTSPAENKEAWVTELFHINNYLFHNSNASYRWLLNNHKEFLMVMLLNWGADQNDQVNILTTEYVCQVNLDQLPQLLYDRNCQGELKIHKKLFESIKNNFKEDDLYCFDHIRNFMISLSKESEETDDLSKEEIAELSCYFGSAEIELCKKYPNYRRGFTGISFIFAYDEIKEIAKNNNYYNIPDFDQVLKVTDWESDRAKGETDDASDDKGSFDYKQLESAPQ